MIIFPCAGKTYFFKGKGFWQFDDRKMRVVSETPSLSAPFWMSCPTGMETNELIPGEERFDSLSSSSSGGTSTVMSISSSSSSSGSSGGGIMILMAWLLLLTQFQL